MKYYRPLVIAAAFGFGLLAGCENAQPAPEEPSLLRRDVASDAATATPEPVPASEQGSFESLVTDYESKDRAIWQKPDMVISLLGNLEGKTVADIGAGTGYFAFRMVPKAKKVIAIEIDRGLIEFMDSIKVRLPERYQPHFETRLASADDPLLKPDEVNAVIMVNTYAYIENRVPYLRRLAQGMAPGADLLIIDFKKNNLNVGPPERFKVGLRQVEQELRNSGYEITKIDNESLDFQYIVLARKKGGGE